MPAPQFADAADTLPPSALSVGALNSFSPLALANDPVNPPPAPRIPLHHQDKHRFPLQYVQTAPRPPSQCERENDTHQNSAQANAKTYPHPCTEAPPHQRL